MDQVRCFFCPNVVTNPPIFSLRLSFFPESQRLMVASPSAIHKSVLVTLMRRLDHILATISGATAQLAEPQLGYSQFWHAVSFTEHTDPVLELRFGPARWLNRFQLHQLQQDFKNSIHCQ